MTRFEEFVRSPYHNKHEEVQQLVQYLNSIYPRFSKKKCERHLLFQVLFPNQPHNQAQLAILFTYGFRLAKAFLQQEIFKTQEEVQSLFLLKAFSQKGKEQFYQKNFELAQTALTKQHLRDSSFYRYQYDLAQASNEDKQFQSWRNIPSAIQEKQAYLDYFYLAEKLKDACQLQMRNKILVVTSTLPFVESILTILQSNWTNYQTIPPITAYFHLYQMLTKGETTHYYAAFQIIEEHSHFFSIKELKDIYIYIQNFCIEQINQNHPDFRAELFKIYQIQLERRLLQDEKGLLSEWHYKNIVTIGLRLKKTGWVLTFIEKYKTEIALESRANAYRFNRAAYAYEIGDYDTVLGLLSQVEYTNTQYSLGARWLLLRTYYELEEQAAFFSLCDAFRQFLQRNQLLSEKKRKGNEQTIRLVRKAFQIKLEASFQNRMKTQKEVGKLQEDIKNAPILFNRGWLDQKIREILML